jgi:hypothetical protein
MWSPLVVTESARILSGLRAKRAFLDAARHRSISGIRLIYNNYINKYMPPFTELLFP